MHLSPPMPTHLWAVNRLRWPVIALALLVALSYGVSLALKNWDLNTYNYVSGDSVTYATFLLQLEDPAALSRDLVYGDVRYGYAAHPIFTRLLQGAFHLAGDDFMRANLLLQALTVTVYMAGMGCFLAAVLRHWPLALTLAVLSSGASVLPVYARLTVTGTFWPVGLPGTPVIPTMMHTALVPWLGWLLLAGLFRPGWQGQPIPRWRALGLGLLVGGTGFLHSVNAMALFEAVTLVAAVQALRRRLPFSAVAGFAAGGGLLLLLDLFATPGLSVALPFEDARLTILSGQAGGMVFPWARPQAETVILLLQGGHLLGSAVLGGLAWRSRQQAGGHRWRVYFVGLQVLYALFILNTHPLLTALVAGYALYRAQRGDAAPLELWLGLLLLVMLLCGPFQQMLALLVWSVLRLTALTGLVYEMARFAHNVYLPFYALAGLALLTLYAALARRVPVLSDRRLPLLWGTAALVVFWLDLGAVLCLLLVALLLLAALLWLAAAGPGRAVSLGRLRLALLPGAALLGLLLVSPVYNPPMPRTLLEPDYLAMTAWVRQNTPPDALFHMANLERSFRFYARRAMVIGLEEWKQGIYNGRNPRLLQDITARLAAAQDDPAQLVQEVTALAVDYIVSPVVLPDLPLPVVYHNPMYRIYRLDEAP